MGVMLKGAFKKFKKPGPFMASFWITLLLVAANIPVLILQDGAWTDAVELLALTTATTLLLYFISMSCILLRILSITLILLNSIFLYFILFYKIKIYPAVMMAIFQTETTEAFEWISITLLTWIAIFGFLPAYLIVKMTKGIGEHRKLRLGLLFSLVALVVGVCGFNAGGSYDYIKPKLKNFTQNEYPLSHPSYLFNKYLPYSYVYNARLYFAKTFKDATEQKTDLTKQHDFSLQDPEVTKVHFVLVIGESARSDRFSLNGYSKNTNPRLSRINNLVSFTDFHALGTSTLTAIPHIFLHERQSKIDSGRKESSFIHILKHVGLKTIWFSRFKSQRHSLIYDISLEADSAAYAASLWGYNQDRPDLLSYDHALLRPLRETVERNDGGLIVLHTKGSHTNYASRLPTENVLHQIRLLSELAPVRQMQGRHGAENSHLRDANLSRQREAKNPKCTHCVHEDSSTAEAASAQARGRTHLTTGVEFGMDSSYDNTILYTDLFLSDTINVLKDKNAVLLYLSDHAESLGEDGVYGHGSPFEIAPKEQTHIPMIWWASDKFLANPANRERFRNIRLNADQPADQSYIFHSVLDCLGVRSDMVNTGKSVCRSLIKRVAHA